jgi:hypothetical protein
MTDQATCIHCAEGKVFLPQDAHPAAAVPPTIEVDCPECNGTGKSKQVPD